MEAKDEVGNVLFDLTLTANQAILYNTTACKAAPYSPCGLAKCTNNYKDFSAPSQGTCADVAQGSNYTAPLSTGSGTPDLVNEVTWYECPTSNKLIMTSNDIPEHFFSLQNPNKPCVYNIHAEFPLTPVVSTTKTETSNILGFGMNGVFAFSPLEAGNNNAVEPATGATLLDAQHWWGHPTAANVWHYQ